MYFSNLRNARILLRVEQVKNRKSKVFEDSWDFNFADSDRHLHVLHVDLL